MDDRKSLTDKLKELNIIYKESVILTSGKPSDFYVDIKKAYGYPEVVKLMVQLVSKEIPKEATVIASTGYGGLPLATPVSLETGKNLTLVRTAPKDHGHDKGGYLDGYIPTPDDKIVIVDDVFTAGTSIRKMLAIFEKEKPETEIIAAQVVVKRGDGQLAIPLGYLIDVEELYN